MKESFPALERHRSGAQSQSWQVISPAPRDVWHDLLRSDPGALITQTPRWLDCICASGNYTDASRLYELAGGQQLVLPMLRLAGLPTALSTEASLPFAWGRGGVVARNPIQVHEIATVFADLRQRFTLRTSIRPSALVGTIWSAAAPADIIAMPRLAHVLDLTGGFDQVWTKSFNSHTRNKIRKAERAGLVIERDTTGKLVPVFYELLEQSFLRWGMQQHEPLWLTRWRGQARDPLRKFETIAHMLGDACRVWVAWLDGQPAATIFIVQDKHATYMRGAMNIELAGPSRANYLLHRLAIEEACQSGCQYYYMGESGTSADLANFKTRFGAVGYPYAEYHIERLPLTSIDRGLRSIIKKLVGFKDA